MNRKVDQWKSRKQSGNYLDEKGKPGKEKDQQNRLETLQYAIMASLRSITGELWTTSAEWDAWYKKDRRKFKIP